MHNQKLWLLAGLVRANAWNCVKLIWAKFENKVALNLYEPLVAGLCDLVSWVIEPYYSSISPSNLFAVPRSTRVQFPVGDIPQAHTLQECIATVEEILKLLGIYICRDGLVVSKLCRLLGGFDDKDKVVDLLKRYIVPGITIGNSGILSAVWKLLKDLSYEQRFDIYTYWRSVSWDGLSLVHQGQTIKDTRSWLKRIANENARKESRSLLKFIFTAPYIVVEEILFQIRSYRNLVPVVISTMAYCQNLILDVVPAVLLDQLHTTELPKLDTDHGCISMWLQNISSFIGNFYRRYYFIDIKPIIDYISQCFSRQEIVEVCILKEIVRKMSGYDPPEKLTEKMLQALGFGPKLRVYSFNMHDERRNAKKSAISLANFLKQGKEKNEAMELLSLMAQQSQRFLFKSDTQHLKLVGLLYDSIVDAMLHLIDFLVLQTENSINYAKLLPRNPLKTLISEYGIPFPIAIYATRPAFSTSEMDAIISQFEEIKPEISLPTSFYAIFWSLSLQDVQNTSSHYDSAKEILSKDLAAKTAQSKSSKNKKEIHRLSSLIEDLDKEKASQELRYVNSQELLKQHCTVSSGLSTVDLVQVLFTQNCLYPRLLCSPSDAIYCAKFIECMQNLRIEGFSTIDVIYQLITEVMPSVHCCTEKEADNIGFFFLELLKILNIWLNNFETLCQGSPGFPQEFTVKTFSEKLTFCYGRMTVTLCKCFQGTSYMRQRNALLVLTKLSPEFPTNHSMADQIMNYLKKLKDSELEDLKLMAQCYYDQLQMKFPPVQKIQPKKTKTNGNEELPKKRMRSSDEERRREKPKEDKKKREEDDRRHFYNKNRNIPDKHNKRPKYSR